MYVTLGGKWVVELGSVREGVSEGVVERVFEGVFDDSIPCVWTEGGRGRG